MRIKKRKHKWLKRDAQQLSNGKYWIMGFETDEGILESISGVTLGPKQVDSLGRVKRVKGLVVWGQCSISNTKKLTPYIPQFMWGPDCPDHIAKDLVRDRGHKVAEVDWDDPKFRKEVGADED